jgi:hypothetical protein
MNCGNKKSAQIAASGPMQAILPYGNAHILRSSARHANAIVRKPGNG